MFNTMMKRIFDSTFPRKRTVKLTSVALSCTIYAFLCNIAVFFFAFTEHVHNGIQKCRK
jgi:hypothetical protein